MRQPKWLLLAIAISSSLLSHAQDSEISFEDIGISNLYSKNHIALEKIYAYTVKKGRFTDSILTETVYYDSVGMPAERDEFSSDGKVVGIEEFNYEKGVLKNKVFKFGNGFTVTEYEYDRIGRPIKNKVTIFNKDGMPNAHFQPAIIWISYEFVDGCWNEYRARDSDKKHWVSRKCYDYSDRVISFQLCNDNGPYGNEYVLDYTTVKGVVTTYIINEYGNKAKLRTEVYDSNMNVKSSVQYSYQMGLVRNNKLTLSETYDEKGILREERYDDKHFNHYGRRHYYFTKQNIGGNNDYTLLK